jgi:hypothetical protein
MSFVVEMSIIVLRNLIVVFVIVLGENYNLNTRKSQISGHIRAPSEIMMQLPTG